MGFGSDLKNSHEAVLKLQDWELRLLETVKKFMALRIKSDKEYASTLQNLCNQVDKESTIQMNYVSNVSKVAFSRICVPGNLYLMPGTVNFTFFRY
uniref:F-BAR domain-containing protein n=1 Tax=Equus asinus TaxID=9793 RepID=A0A9L0JMV3_EQUAS